MEKLNNFLTLETDNIQQIRIKIEEQLYLTGDVFQFFVKEGINAENQDQIMQLDEQQNQSEKDQLDPKIMDVIDRNRQLQEKCAQLSQQYFKCLEELIENNIQINELTTSNQFHTFDKEDNDDDL